MFSQKNIFREIYNAKSTRKATKKKSKKPKHDVVPSTATPDQEQPKPSEQATNDDASLPAAETDDQNVKLGEKNTVHENNERVDTGEMSEPRARATRQKGQLNFGTECKYCVTSPS
jgi:hypothetical protein